MSKNTSPADGGGRRAKPRPGAPGSRSCTGTSESRLCTCSQACWRRAASAGAEIPGTRDARRDVGQLGDAADAGVLELDRLRARDAGDERQVVVGAAAVAAARPPVAVGAVLDGIRVGRRRALAVRLQRAEEAALHAVGVGLEVARAERADLVGAEHHVHALGREPLDLPDHRGVEEQLEDHVGLRVRGELGVGGLVGEGAEVGRHPDLEQEVRRAAPGAGREGGLVDHVAARPHRLDGRLRGALAGRDLHHLQAALAQPLQVLALVLAAALGDQLGVRPRDPLQDGSRRGRGRGPARCGARMPGSC